MDAREAASLINSKMALRPGWKITAYPQYNDRVQLNIQYDTFNSNEYNAPTYKGEPFTASLFRTISVQGLTSPAEVVGRVLQLCLELEAHEWQEFTRYQDASGRWVAPFHPHRPNGHRNWMSGFARPQLHNSLAAA